MYYNCVRITATLLAILCSCSAYSADGHHAELSIASTLGKLVAALMFVLLVFWVFALVLRQLQGTNGRSSDNLKIVSTLVIGQKERLMIVQIGEQQLLIGTTPQNISIIHTLDEPLSSVGNFTDSQTHDFREKLKIALRKQVSS